MTKAIVKRKSKKSKVVKKIKARQIIKQKVVINLGKEIRRARGRPRKASSEKREAVQPGQTIKTDFTTQNQFYDQQRASVPYIEELQNDVKRLESGQNNAMNNLMGMQRAGLMLQMQQGELQDRLNNNFRSEPSPHLSRLLPPMQFSETPKKGRGGARVGAGRKVGSKNKPREEAALGPTMEERLRSQTQAPPPPATPPPTPPPAAPPATPPPVAPSKPKRGGIKEKKSK
jgi:hypothetical protein